MLSGTRLAAPMHLLQRSTLYNVYHLPLRNVRVGLSTSFGMPPNGRTPLLRTLGLSTTRFNNIRPLPRHQEEKNGDEALTKQVPEHRVPQPIFNLPGGLTFPFTRSALADAALTTIIGLVIGECSPVGWAENSPQTVLVFAGGVAYLAWYKKRVLHKVRYCALLSLAHSDRKITFRPDRRRVRQRV